MNYLRSSALGALFSIGMLVGCQQTETPPVAPPVDTDDDDAMAPLCTTDADCPDTSSPYCSAKLGCVVCVIDEQCGPGRRCEEGSCELFDTCGSSSDCTDETHSVCNTISKECRECVFDSDCGAGSVGCYQGVCEVGLNCSNSLDCPLGTVCSDNRCLECADDGDCDDGKTCDGSKCVVGCTSDKDCVGAGRLCDKRSGQCTDCFQNSDCPEAYYCEGQSCLLDTCVQDAGWCSEDGLTMEFCDEYGAGVDLEPCRPQSTCTEEDGQIGCEDWICEPGSVKCNSAQEIVGCDASGLEPRVIVDCVAAGGVCEGTSCVDVVCDAELMFCMGNTIMQCSSNGASFEALSTCDAATHFCDDVTGQCQPRVCDPGQTTCKDDVVRTCTANGSGFDEGVACDADQTCYSGECRVRLCDVAEKVCVGRNVFNCIQNGTKTSFSEVCDVTEGCGPSGCFALVCEPNTAACDGGVTGVCNADGSAIEHDSNSLDCATSDRVCVSGECLEAICTPGAPACDEARATSCNATGTGYVEGGTICDPDGEFCEDGVCVDEL
jgi:hypothetical protein